MGSREQILRRRVLQVLIGTLLALQLCVPMASAQNTRSHRHEQAAETEIPRIKIIRAKLPENARRSEFAASREFEGFTVYEAGGAGYRIFFVERRSGSRSRQIYEIRRLGLEWRPFTDLVWRDDRTLVFDCWANPHFGTHYEFDAKQKRLKKVLIFKNPGDDNQ